MTGIIITKVSGKVSKDVVVRLRNMSKKFADDDVAVLIQEDNTKIKPKIHFEIKDLSSINSYHIHEIIEAVFVNQKGKGVGDTEFTISFKERTFTLPDEFKICIKYLS